MNINDDQQHHQPAHRVHSWWRTPLIGYPLAIVLVASAFLMPTAERFLGIRDYFIETPFVIATILVGWFWGMGPALLALVVEVLALDYWIIPPLRSFSFFLWPDIVSFATFIIIQLVVLGLVRAQKKYRQQLLLAHQVVSTNAEKLAENNQILAETNIQLHRVNQELALSNDQLEQANHVKDLFLSLASHELKTPITTIQGQVQLALRRLTRQQQLPTELTFLPEHLVKVESQTHRLSALVNDLLNLSSLRSGQLPLRIKSCDICLLCQSVVDDQRDLVNRLIDLKLPSCPLILPADDGRLSQVITNLIVNAIKYSPEDSVVSVEVTRGSELVILQVHNTGPAIPQELQEHIFEPFYRTPEAQKSATPGWGLGLAISKAVVEQHGGHIRVESSTDHGTTFRVELPIEPYSAPLEDASFSRDIEKDCE